MKLLHLNIFLIGEGVLELLKEFHKLLYLLEELEELKELLLGSQYILKRR